MYNPAYYHIFPFIKTLEQQKHPLRYHFEQSAINYFLIRHRISPLLCTIYIDNHGKITRSPSHRANRIERARNRDISGLWHESDGRFFIVERAAHVTGHTSQPFVAVLLRDSETQIV